MREERFDQGIGHFVGAGSGLCQLFKHEIHEGACCLIVVIYKSV
jgi:hypothetical protein